MKNYILITISLLIFILNGCSSGGKTSTNGSSNGNQSILKAIEVTPPVSTIPQGINQQFTATGIYSDNTTKNITDQVTWSSTNPAFASVNNKNDPGLVQARASGNTKIIATLGSLVGNSNINISTATLSSINITNLKQVIAIGTTDQLIAIGVFSDNSKINITNEAIWQSANTKVSTVNKGSVHALSPGDSIIYARLNSIIGDTPIEVTNATLKSITITPVNPDLPLGLSEQLTAIGTYSDNTTQDITNQVSWSSSNQNIAAIGTSNGLLNATGIGNSTITASVNGVSATTGINITNARLIAMTITPPNSTIAAGLTEQFTATGIFSNNTTLDITNQVVWLSSNPAIAMLSNAAGSNGLLTTFTSGNITISATSVNGVSATASTLVTSAILTTVNITPVNLSLPLGTKEQMTAIGTYSDSSTKNITDQVTWNSTNKTAVTISNAAGSNGVIIGSGIGSSTIQATLKNVSASTNTNVTNAVLTSITITPVNPKIPLGSTQQLTATGIYSDNSTKDLTTQVTWSSNNSNVAIVSNAKNSNGLLKSIAIGNVTINATLNGISGISNLMVSDAVLKEIITPENVKVPLGITEQLTATGTYTDNSTKDITEQVTWKSNSNSIAIVSNAKGSYGLVTPQAVGTTVITASLNGVTDNLNLTVSAAKLESIMITSSTPSIPLGITEQFTAKGVYSDKSIKDITTQVTWNSLSSQVATIDNASNKGLLTTLSIGSTTITASLSGITQTTNLTVTSAILQAITISPINQNLPLGLTIQFTATGVYSDRTTKDITTQTTWTTANPSVAIVSNVSPNKGKLSSVSLGSTTVQATLAGISQTSSINVTSATLQSIDISPNNPSVGAGLTINFSATGTYSDSSKKAITTQVTWNSTNTAIASISNASGSNGLVTGIKQGNVTITAILGVISQNVNLTVTSAILSSITITPNPGNIFIGTNLQLTATAYFSDNSHQDYTNQVNWTSSNTSIVTVNNSGMATSTYTAGKATITAGINGISNTTTINTTLDSLQQLASSGIAINGQAAIDYISIPERVIFSDGSGNLYGFGLGVGSGSAYPVLTGYYDDITSLSINDYNLWIGNSASVGGSMNHQSTANISRAGNNTTDTFNSGNWPQVTVAGSSGNVYYGDQRGNIWHGWVSDSSRLYDGPTTLVTAITYNFNNHMIYFAEGSQIFSLNSSGAVTTIVNNTYGNTVTALLTDPQGNLYFNQINKICSINPNNLGAGFSCSIPNQTGTVVAFAWDTKYNRLVALTNSKEVFVSYPNNGNLNNSNEISINYVSNVSGTNVVVVYDIAGQNSYIIDSAGIIYTLAQN